MKPLKKVTPNRNMIGKTLAQRVIFTVFFDLSSEVWTDIQFFWVIHPVATNSILKLFLSVGHTCHNNLTYKLMQQQNPPPFCEKN